ncbi:MAG: PPOX class F420-dependent oxidoreductase [Chloroflexi bacterium]|nr:PPOX class F420-dependent oxidoreductase [Chloroflexota bacterium]MYD48363.1 PPOX class F420-dependent oxidoreductase [Chloroflexota bacterium]
MPRLTPQEVDDYLAGPHVAHFASIRPNGAPHISPVWYQWQAGGEPDTGTVTVVSGDSAVKTRNIRRNPKVAISVATDEWPYQYVILEGDATVSDDNIKEAVRSIFSRYEGAERGEEDANELTQGDQQLVAIVVDVNRILSWKGDGE